MKYLVWTLAAIAGIALLLLGGLLVRPTQFARPTDGSASAPDAVPVRHVQIPEGLPAPVERWYRADYPDGLPVWDSVVMRGTGTMRIGPLSLPFRHLYESRPGAGFYRKMDITWFNLAFLHGLDTCIDGVGVMNTPVGPASGPKIDQGANVVAWLELLSSPGNLTQTEGVRWEPIDDSTARLVFPSRDGEDWVDVTFDPQTHAPVAARTERYRNADDTTKTGWTARMLRRGEVDGGAGPISVEVDAQWDGDPKPWATFVYEAAWANAEVPEFDAAVRAGGVKIGDAR